MSRSALQPGCTALALCLCACATVKRVPSDNNDGGAGGSDVSTVAVGTSASSVVTTGGFGGGSDSLCKVAPEMLDAPCIARPGEMTDINLVEKWTYAEPVVPGIDSMLWAGPTLVANFTDDNGDGAIDLCDTPDVLAQAQHVESNGDGHQHELLVVSGADGSLLRRIGVDGMRGTVAALADLDGDGVPEILMTKENGHAIALSPDGTVLWESTVQVFNSEGAVVEDPFDPIAVSYQYLSSSAFAVHDLEGDGAPEVIFGMTVLDAAGNLRFRDPDQASEHIPADLGGRGSVRPTAADLDGDGVLEVLFGHVTYSASGAELWRLPEIAPSGLTHAADFDGDGAVEVLIASEEGLSLVSAEGDLLWGPTYMGFGSPRYWCWQHPIAITDFGQDGKLEALVNTCERRMALTIEVSGPTILREEPVPLESQYGAPMEGSIAFDLRGKGPDWIAHHHRNIRIFTNWVHMPLDDVSVHFSTGFYGYPVIADVDNDGSADVVAIREDNKLVVYEDETLQPSPARRIWNQWAYAPNAVREDATIPPAVTGPAAIRTQGRPVCKAP